MSDYLDPNNEELLKDFFAEAEQQVEQLESNILVIENDPTNHEAIDEIFRAAHTLKGGSATVEMNELSHFTHTVEDVLDEIRSDRLSVDEKVVDILLTSIDVIKAMLESRQNGQVYSENIDDLLNTLHSYIPEKGSGKKAPVITVTKAPVAPEPTPSGQKRKQKGEMKVPPLTESEYQELKSACEGNQKLWCVAVQFDESNPMNTVGGIQVYAALKNVGNILKTVPDFDELYEDQFFEDVYYYISSASDGAAIENASYLSDVTLLTDATEITEDNYNANPDAVLPVAKVEAHTDEVDAEEAEAEAEAAAEAAVESEATESGQPAEVEKLNKSIAAKNEAAKEAPKKDTQVHVQQGSILRVDSKRIDNLLNLVSEAVIIKASFNQLTLQASSQLTQLQSIESQYKDKLHSLFDKMPDYWHRLSKGESFNDVKKSMLEEYGSMNTIFDAYESDIKGITNRFRSYTQQLGTISGELQEGVMKIRMVPINQIFSRFPRVVRDLQKDLNKKINLEIEGEDTELDKSVVEDLLDPIMHCVRNSVDHGIETPEVRKAAGKDETGTVLLKASNEGNMIVIEIKDDGAGIDVQKIRQKAIDKGLIHPDKTLTDQEAYNLIMQPGFSTADKISNISGRGVGLDVVKTMINNLKGNISISSVKGEGTTFTIKLPLTLAIIQGLLVRVGKEIYSIPIANVIESQCINIKDLQHIDNYEILNVRNEVISILRLSRLFNIESNMNDEECYIVIVGTQEKKIGVMVDSLIGEEDVVIKPLRDKFTVSPGIAGASILGDGSVSLIIDVSQLLDLGVRQEILAQQKEQFEA
ncbi:MAG: chemotaxis protein CheA [Treponema sp.]|nr:chemotaxis protein CheA [Treponema sp.]